MNWFRHSPLWASVILVCGMASAAEIYFLQASRREQLRARETLARLEQERDLLVRRLPATAVESSSALARDIISAEQKLERLQSEWPVAARWLAPLPRTPSEAFFATAEAIERMRRAARNAQVGIAPDERFGFASYAQEGPEVELLGAVHRQVTIVEHLVTSLLESRPDALTAVQRERPANASTPSSSARGGVPTDYFEFTANQTRHPGDARDGEAFRIEFTGGTETLRIFLNALQRFELPVIVRTVEVALLDPASGRYPASASTLVPVVPRSRSRFTVTVECVELPASHASPTS